MPAGQLTLGGTTRLPGEETAQWNPREGVPGPHRIKRIQNPEQTRLITCLTTIWVTIQVPNLPLLQSSGKPGVPCLCQWEVPSSEKGALHRGQNPCPPDASTHSGGNTKDPRTWQMLQLGHKQRDCWPAKGFAELSVPTTQERRCHFHSKQEHCSPRPTPSLSPKQNPTKTTGGKKKKECSMEAIEGGTTKGSQIEVREGWSSVELPQQGCHAEQSYQDLGVWLAPGSRWE